jgi:hypothetical protein
MNINDYDYPCNPENISQCPRFFGVYSEPMRFFDEENMLTPLTSRELVYDSIRYNHDGNESLGNISGFEWVFRFDDFEKQLLLAPVVIAVTDLGSVYYIISYCSGRADHDIKWLLHYSVVLGQGRRSVLSGAEFLMRVFHSLMRCIPDEPEWVTVVRDPSTELCSIPMIMVRTLFGGFPFISLYSVVQPAALPGFIKEWFECLYSDAPRVFVFDDPNQVFSPHHNNNRWGSVYRVDYGDTFQFRVCARNRNNKTEIFFRKVPSIPVPNSQEVEDSLSRHNTR